MFYLHKREFNFGRCTVHSDNAERHRLDNLVSFTLHELVFLECYSEFVSYCTRSHRILTVVKFYHTFWLRNGCRPMRYLSSMGAPLTRTVITCESALNQSDVTTVLKLVSTMADQKTGGAACG